MVTRAEFEAFFAGTWQKLLERTEVPDMPGASWDRKACYLFMTGSAREEPEAERPVATAAELDFDGY